MKTDNRSSKAVLLTVQGTMIAAVYVIITMAFAPFSFGPVQFRISEALTVLPFFTPAAVPGVFAGCLLADILGGGAVWEICSWPS